MTENGDIRESIGSLKSKMEAVESKIEELKEKLDTFIATDIDIKLKRIFKYKRDKEIVNFIKFILKSIIWITALAIPVLFRKLLDTSGFIIWFKHIFS